MYVVLNGTRNKVIFRDFFFKPNRMFSRTGGNFLSCMLLEVHHCRRYARLVTFLQIRHTGLSSVLLFENNDNSSTSVTSTRRTSSMVEPYSFRLRINTLSFSSGENFIKADRYFTTSRP